MVKVLRSLVRGPLEPHITGFAEELLRRGYSRSSAEQHVCFLAHLDRWMCVEGIGLDGLSGPVIERYLAQRRAAGYVEYRSVKAVRPLLDYLTPLGVLPAAEEVPPSPVFGSGACLVGDCGRFARSRGLCQAHRLRWDAAGRPDLASFAAATDPRWRNQQPNTACRIEGCGYGTARGGLCSLHAQRWERAGRPDLDIWLADPPPIKKPAADAVCRIGHCDLWPRSAQPFCHSHYNTWRGNGRPDVKAFVARFAEVTVLADEVVRLDGLPSLLRLEIAYALQCRHDERTSKTPPAIIMQMVRALKADPVTSLLEVPEEQLRLRIYPSMPNARALALYARRRRRCCINASGALGAGDLPSRRSRRRQGSQPAAGELKQ